MYRTNNRVALFLIALFCQSSILYMFVASTLFKRRTSHVSNLMPLWGIDCFSLAVYL